MDFSNGNIRYETAPDGTKLRIGHWPTANSARRIVLCHGRTEFLEKYAEVIGELNGRGFDVWSMDWRGQGLSGRALDNPQKGHIDNFATYMDDLVWFFSLMDAESAAETVLMGHSMGGHIVLRTLLEGRITADRAIMTAPMLDFPMRRLSRMVIAGLCQAAGLTGFGGRYVIGMGDYDAARIKFDGNPLTGDRKRFEAIYAAIAANPGVEMGGPTFGWLGAAFNSIGRLHGLSGSSRPSCPILLCTAMADTVVSVDAQNAMGNALPTCTQLRLEDAAHEILHETDAIRGRFWDAFDRFTAA